MKIDNLQFDCCRQRPTLWREAAQRLQSVFQAWFFCGLMYFVGSADAIGNPTLFQSLQPQQQNRPTTTKEVAALAPNSPNTAEAAVTRTLNSSLPVVQEPALQEPVLQDQNAEEDGIINMTDQGAIDLQGLVRWACEQQGFELVIDNKQFQEAQNKVIFFSKVKISQSTAMLLVQEVLRANGFALVDGQVDGWKRIASLANVAPFTDVVAADKVAQKDFEYVTAVFQLDHMSPENARVYIQSLLRTDSVPQGQVDAFKTIEASKLLIVTDMVRNIRRIQTILKQIDVPQDEIKVSFYKAKNLEAKELESQIMSILSIQKLALPDVQSREPRPAAPAQASQIAGMDVKISSDVRTNRLILVGKNQPIAEIMKLIEGLDVPLDTKFRTYSFQHVSAKRIDDLIRQSLSGVNEAITRIYQSTVDAQSNQLIVTARDEIHAQISDLKTQLDRPKTTNQEQSPMQFYKLKNVKASDLVGTLQAIERKTRPSVSRQRQPNSGIRGRDGFGVNGPNNINQGFREGPPSFPPGSNLFDNPGNQFGSASLGDPSSFDSPSLSSLAQIVSDIETPNKIVPGEAQITIDEHTNTLIVVAEPQVQELYARLIEKLDIRRPQVLIEAHIVTITGNDDLNLGVEISGGDRVGDKKLFSFTSFGLSEVNPTNGALKIIPGVGFNGTLIDPQTADVVLRALATHGRSRVISSPKIVVDDNANGLLSSVAEEPFASVNSTNQVATTTFAGFVQAGTTINVTPHISEADHLNLEFDILVNSFTDAGSAGLPPPRNTDQIVSQVTIPDGFTVIVGGLNRQRLAQEISGLPFLEKIPLLKLLASSQTNSSSEGMIFVFLRPTILRDDQFRDLIYLSGEEFPKAGIDGDFPFSKPILIK